MIRDNDDFLAKVKENAQIERILDEVWDERFRAIAKHGDQTKVPSFVDGVYTIASADAVRSLTQKRFREGRGSWADILLEEVAEAMEEVEDPAALRAELIQVAQVAVSWVHALDSN